VISVVDATAAAALFCMELLQKTFVLLYVLLTQLLVEVTDVDPIHGGRKRKELDSWMADR
jgi:hypothetical protein